jgi:hypothetical protein
MAEKRTIELEIQDNSKTLKQQYKEAVAELQKMVSAYGDMSEQAVEAAKKAAELKDQIEDTNDLMKSFKGEGAFIAMNKAMSAVASGFSAVEGGLALIGVEGEAVQETMLKVQAAMALAQGLEGLEDAGRAFKNLGVTAKNALSGIKAGVAATGIGLLVVAVGTLVAYWDDIKEAVSGISEEQKKLNKLSQQNAVIAKETYDSFQLQENSLRLQGKTEKQILQLKIDKLNASIKTAEVDLKRLEETAKLEIEAAARNQNILKMIIRGGVELAALGTRLLVAPIDMVLKTANLVSEKLGFGTITALNLNAEITKINEMYSEVGSKFFFDPAAVKADSDATIKTAKQGIAQMKSDRDGLLLQLKQQDQQGSQDRVNTEKGAAKEKLDLERENTDKRLALMADGYDKEVALAKEKNKREKEDLLASSKDKIVDAKQLAEAQKLIDETLKKELLQLDIKYNSDKLLTWEEKNKKEIEQKQIEFDAEMEAAAKRIEIREAEAEKKKQIDKEEIQRRNELRQKTLQLAGDTFSALGDLAGSFNTKNEKDARKQFQVQKAFNLAAAITNTAMAVTGALTAGGNPIKLATGMQFVEAGIAATVGAANIIKISNSKFGGGGSGGGGNDTNVPTGAAPMTANFNTIGSSGINQLAQLQQTPTQAYVVSGEVTSAQALDRNRVQNATL